MQRHGVTYILTTDQTEFEEVEHSLVAVVVLFGLLAVMAAVLMAWLLGGTVVRPVKKLAREVQRCASEKEFRPLSVELTNDEVGYLAKTCENSLRKLHETVQSERFFASDLSHEFRTHLSIVSTTAELMREIGDLTPQQERQLAKITLAAERMQRLIHVLLALARDKDVKAADNDIKYLPDIAREIQEEDEPDARQKGLRMVIDDRSGTPPPRLSDSFASCVLSNLVRNAVKFHPWDYHDHARTYTVFREGRRVRYPQGRNGKDLFALYPGKTFPWSGSRNRALAGLPYLHTDGVENFGGK